jgi:hypothetical protein
MQPHGHPGASTGGPPPAGGTGRVVAGCAGAALGFLSGSLIGTAAGYALVVALPESRPAGGPGQMAAVVSPLVLVPLFFVPAAGLAGLVLGARLAGRAVQRRQPLAEFFVPVTGCTAGVCLGLAAAALLVAPLTGPGAGGFGGALVRFLVFLVSLTGGGVAGWALGARLAPRFSLQGESRRVRVAAVIGCVVGLAYGGAVGLPAAAMLQRLAGAPGRAPLALAVVICGLVGGTVAGRVLGRAVGRRLVGGRRALASALLTLGGCLLGTFLGLVTQAEFKDWGPVRRYPTDEPQLLGLLCLPVGGAVVGAIVGDRLGRALLGRRRPEPTTHP